MTNKNKPSKFQQLSQNGRTVPVSDLMRNRAVIKRQQEQRVKPVVIATSEAVPWWGPFGANKQEAE